MADKVKKKKIKYITLMWEALPEKVSFYIIPRSEVSKSEMRMLRACHNNWINSSSLDTSRGDSATVSRALSVVSNMIDDPKLKDEGWFDNKHRAQVAEECGLGVDSFNEIYGKWYRFRIDTEKPRMIPRSRLYRSGIYL